MENKKEKQTINAKEARVMIRENNATANISLNATASKSGPVNQGGIDPAALLVFIFVAGTRPISHRVGRSVGRSVCRSVGLSVGPSHFAFFAFLGILRVGKFVSEYAPAQIITAPVQIITAPAQIITAPAQPPATGAVVYTALFKVNDNVPCAIGIDRYSIVFHWHR